MSSNDSTTATSRPTPVQRGAQVVGAAFLLVGLLGFVPGVTTDVDQMTFAGHESGSFLLGIFHVSVLHNIVHLLFGVAGLALSRRADSARKYLLVGGALYLVLWIYGLVIDEMSMANFVPLNNADDWLHLGLGLGMIALGLILPRRHSVGTATARSSAGGAIQ